MTRECPRCGSRQHRQGALTCARCGASLGAQAAAAPRRPGAEIDRPTPSAGLDLCVGWDGEERRWPLGAATLSLGRDATADVVVDHPEISRRHARIERMGDGYRIVDAESRNGLYHRGRKVPSASLSDREEVRLGPSSAAPRVVLAAGRARSANDGPPTPQAFEVGTTPIVVGRDAACDVVLNHPTISREHARIALVDGVHQVEDLGSMNGTFVRGERVGKATLGEGDVVRIGPYALTFTRARFHSSVASGGLRIEARDLGRRAKGSGANGKWILDDVTIAIEPGEFVALLGPSGAGKSTLLTSLCGFPMADVGSVLIDRADFYAHQAAFRPLLGYVPQSDIVHRSLSVHEALDFAARLRLPGDTTAAERAERVERVLDDVGLLTEQGTIVGRLSGGQRKRVSTAVELLADPKLLFLDEPTSGLDPGLDKTMMDMFRRLADQGRTVILVTHTTMHIDRCDLVAFVARGGRLAFFGTPAEALKTFEAPGYADVYRALHQQPDRWVEKYADSDLRSKWIVGRIKGAPAAEGDRSLHTPSGGLGPLRQFGTLFRRQLALYRRDGGNVAILLVQAPIIAGLLLLLADPDVLRILPVAAGSTDAKAVADALKGALRAQTLVNIMASVAVWFGLLNAAREITKERTILARERLAGLKVVPYLAAKFLPLAALCFVQMAVLLGAVVMRAGVPEAGLVAGPFLDLLLTLVLTSLGGVGMGLLLSSTVANEDRAMSVVPILLIPQLLLGGILFHIPENLGLLSKVTLTYWATRAMGSVLDLCAAQGGTCDVERLPLDYDPTAGALTHDWWALAGLIAVFLVLATAFVARRRQA